MKNKLTLLKHILIRTNNLCKITLYDWKKGDSKWVKACKGYMDELGWSLEDMESKDTVEIQKKIDALENEKWKQGMQNKVTLVNYRKVKTRIREDRLWTNSNPERILRKL